jgi:hypothetical protein
MSFKSGFPLKKPKVLAKRPKFQLFSACCITILVVRSWDLPPSAEAAARGRSATQKLALGLTHAMITAATANRLALRIFFPAPP